MDNVPAQSQPGKPELEMRLSSTWREWLRATIPVVLACAAVIGVAWPFIEPAPPRKVIIATGPEGSEYNEYARRYAAYFAQHGIELELRKTGGARENFDLLLDVNAGVDAAIVQGGTAPRNARERGVEAVCAVAYEPLFIVYRNEPAKPPRESLNDFKGQRIAVGSLKGGTRTLSIPLLQEHGLMPRDGSAPTDGTTLVDEGGQAAAKSLLAGTIDVAFFAVSPETPYMAALLREPSVSILNMRQAQAYAHRFDFLAAVTLREGVLDLQRNIPSHDVKLAAPYTMLVVRRQTHPAVVQLLMQAAKKLHGGRDLIAPPNTFPSLDCTELPIASEARYYFNANPSLLQRRLPFWLASLIDRTMILIIPLLVVLVPMIRFAPALYRWRVRSRIYRWYKRLRLLDQRATQPATPSQREIDQAHAYNLEAEVASVRVPLSYMEEFYNLRLHVAYVRDRLKSARVVAPEEMANAAQT